MNLGITIPLGAVLIVCGYGERVNAAMETYNATVDPLATEAAAAPIPVEGTPVGSSVKATEAGSPVPPAAPVKKEAKAPTKVSKKPIQSVSPPKDRQAKRIRKLEEKIEELGSEIRGLKKKNAGTKKTKPKKYDNVPPQHIDSIARRLRIVDQILRQHQRAYDYRSLTTSQLRAIQRELNRKK